MKNSLILAFGFKQRRGKSTACNYLQKYITEQTKFTVCQVSFADALRAEVTEATDHGRTMEQTCKDFGVEFDRNAPVDAQYPYGKQRKLLQVWGTEYRRKQYGDDYWVKRTAEMIKRYDTDLTLIPDMRFKNEAEYVVKNGVTIRLDRPNFTGDVNSGHQSEIELEDYKFDFVISANSKGDLEDKALDVFRQVMESATLRNRNNSSW